MGFCGSWARRGNGFWRVEFGSGCGAVLVDESGAGGLTLDRPVWADGGDVFFVVWCSLVDSLVWQVCVVVVDVFIE